MGFITAIGFATFGSASSGLILNNYSSNDPWIFASRIAVAVSLVFSYPLAFQGCRDGIIDLLNIPREKRDNRLSNMTTIVILSVLTLLAATLTDVSLVLALGGATLGNALTYVYPYLMYKATVTKYGLKGESRGLAVAAVSAVLGIVMGGIGAKMAISK
jgi:amino acid permease